MVAKIEFFPVDNGDMTLITLESGRVILIDINIRKAADDESDQEKVDVRKLLEDRLDRDADGRLYVDSFLLTHPDADHCRGLVKHFHLGSPAGWKESDDKILVREMWSSPIVFRRKNDVEGALCDDASAWWGEARRRVKLYRDTSDKTSIIDGDYIQILGKDKDGKTDDLSEILVETNSEITKICGKVDNSFSAILLSPLVVDGDEVEDLKGKNNSSVALRFGICGGEKDEAGLFLTGGDAGVEIWERIWSRNSSEPERLSYNILQAPHHCSWHALSYDSWSESKGEAVVAQDARSALAQATDGALIISSSKEIFDDLNDPPCIGAKREYEDILGGVSGTFLCTANDCGEATLMIEIGADGPSQKSQDNGSGSAGLLGLGLTGATKKAEKRGGGRYA